MSPGRHLLLRAAGVAVALAAAVLLVRVAGLDRWWVLVPVAMLLPWALWLAAAGGLAAALLDAPRLGALAALVVLGGVAVVAPRALPGPAPDAAPAGPRLTVAVANLKVGRAQPAAVVAAARNAQVDVLATVELTDRAVAGLREAGLDALLPQRELRPVGRVSGGGVHSAVPFTVLGPPPVAGGGGHPTVLLEVAGAPPVRLSTAHPVPPVGGGRAAAWRGQLAALPDPPAGPGEVGLLLGDLNATLDHHALRSVLDRGWVDAADAAGDGLRPTFSGLGWGSPVPPVALDHVLVDPRVAVEGVEVRDLPGSDHAMVVAHLRLPTAP